MSRMSAFPERIVVAAPHRFHPIDSEIFSTDWPLTTEGRTHSDLSRDELRVVVASSNNGSREDVQVMLESEPGVTVVDEYHDLQARPPIHNQNADLLMLDVEPSDGRQCQDFIKNLEIDIPLIVVASNERCAVWAFEARAVDFLLRPLDGIRVHQAVDRARREIRNNHYRRLAQQMMSLLQQPRTQNTPDQLVCKINGRLVFLDLNEIDWIGAAAKHVQLHAGAEFYLVRESIGQLAERLDKERFVRIHRSVIVNVQRIKELQPCNAGEYIAVLKNGKRLPCSRGYRAELERYISRCVRTANTSHS